MVSLLYDAAGPTYTVVRVHASAGHAFGYEMRPEFNGTPDAIVIYHAGKLHRFCPGGQLCNPQGIGLPVEPFTKIGTYNFIVSEDAEWDCISPMGAFPHRVIAEALIHSGEVSGDVYVSEGLWRIGPDDDVFEGPFLALDWPPGTFAERLSGTGVLLSNIRTEPLEV